MAERPQILIPPTPDAEVANRRRTAGWWGIASVAAALVGGAFLPAALLGGGEPGAWANQLDFVSPLWVACCLTGVTCGILGVIRRRRDLPRQWIVPFVGVLFSLLMFVVLTISMILGKQ